MIDITEPGGERTIKLTGGSYASQDQWGAWQLREDGYLLASVEGRPPYLNVRYPCIRAELLLMFMEAAGIVHKHPAIVEMRGELRDDGYVPIPDDLHKAHTMLVRYPDGREIWHDGPAKKGS